MSTMTGAAMKRTLDRVRELLGAPTAGPAGCSQVWFHRLWPYATVYLPDRRLVFLDRDGRPTRGAMQDSAVYVVDNLRPRERPEVYVLRVDGWLEMT